MPSALTIVEFEGKFEWKLAEYENEQTFSHVVEIAKSGRARCRKCAPDPPQRPPSFKVSKSRRALPCPPFPLPFEPRRCSELIAKDSVRIGVPIKWRGGLFGWISSWQHPACLRVPGVTRDELRCELHGVDALTDEQADEVLDQLTSDKGVELEEVDPNDPAFTKREDPVPELPAPAALTRPLLQFQKEGLGWMVANEAGAVRGGILADEMGMGKTIQTISLLLHAKAERAKAAVEAAKEGKALTAAERPGPTLIVVPTSALVQWEDEIRNCTQPGSLSVLVYYSDRKTMSKETLEGVDVVLTTYPVVEGEWRKVINRAMVECEYCGKKLLPRSLVVHQKYFCGPDAVRTAKLAMREKKQNVANEKAMRTLKIKQGKASDVVEAALPTPGNLYRELMSKAGRPAMSMYDSAIKARQNPKDPTAVESVDDASDSDVVIVGETPAKVEEEDAVLMAVLEISRLEEEERRIAAAKVDANALAKTSRSRKRAVKAVTENSDVIGSHALVQAASSGVESTVKRAHSKATQMKKEEQDDPIVTIGQHTNDVKGKDTRQGVKPRNVNENINKAPVTSRGRAKGRNTKGKAVGKRKSRTGYDSDDDKDWTPGAAESAQEEHDAQIARAVASGHEFNDVIVCGAVDAGNRRSSTASASSEGAEPGDDDVDLSDSLLHTVDWNRIVLDEAHKIKARTTNTAKCIYALKSTTKWCLTGTPLQNRVGELYSLVRFLRMDPHAYYFCKVKGCECKSLCWNFGPNQKACTQCGHPSPRHFSHFNQHVINPINRYGYVGDGRKGFLTLRKDILLPAQLRRTKAERAEDVKLPSLTIKVHVCQMDEVERDFYESLYMLTRAKFDGYVKKGSVLHNYAHIFELLSRLRQACDHPYLVVHSKNNATKTLPDINKRAKVSGDAKASDNDEAIMVAAVNEPKYWCGMCQEEVDAEDAALSGCKHVFHRECIMQYASCAPEKGKKVTCPVCRVALTIDLQPSDLSGANKPPRNAAAQHKKDELPSKSILSRIDLSQYTSSVKVDALLKGLNDMRSGKDGHLNKAIVFSQYTSMIEIVDWRLKKDRFTVAKLLGSMPITQRAANLKAFREDPNVSVILMSLKSGGEGLNLQAANYVFVLEPWWNPAVEMQAIMRAHRIGQTRGVTAVRFSTKDTIEERMMQLQEKKKLVFEGCMDGNQEALAQLTEEDLQFLFKR